MGIIPTFGSMKKAEKRAQVEGILAPPGSDKVEISLGDIELPDNPKAINFFLPLVVLVASTIYFGIDAQMGVLITLGFMFALYIPQKLLNVEEFVNVSIEGMKQMLYVLVLLILSFVFSAAVEELGFIDYVVQNATGFMTAAYLPFIIFVIFAITEFFMGLVWGLYAIALPIVIPLAMGIGANPLLAVAAVISAGVWGSHACFFVDTTLLSSASTGCENFRHATTQLPLALVSAVLTAAAFLVTGFVM